MMAPDEAIRERGKQNSAVGRNKECKGKEVKERGEDDRTFVLSRGDSNKTDSKQNIQLAYKIVSSWSAAPFFFLSLFFSSSLQPQQQHSLQTNQTNPTSPSHRKNNLQLFSLHLLPHHSPLLFSTPP
jgi:hypothetical protein